LLAAVDAFVADSNSAHATYGPMSTWDTSLVTSMQGIFCAYPYENYFSDQGCNPNKANLLDADTDLSGWDTSNVESMEHMFTWQESYGGIGLGSWDTSRVNDFDYMFLGANAFNADIRRWDVSKGTKFHKMLGSFQSWVFNHDVSSWNVAQAQDMSYMFLDADNLGALDPCYKRRIYDSFGSQVGALFTAVATGRYGHWAQYPECPSGAIIELTGDQPQLLFGDPGAPTCKLFLDRDNSRLESTCSIFTNRRRLEAECVECKSEIENLKAQVKELHHSLSKLIPVSNASNGVGS